MGGSVLNAGSSSELNRLFDLLTNSAAETATSLVGKTVVIRSGESRLLDHDALISSLPVPHGVACGSLDKAYVDSSMWVMLDIKDAIAVSGMLMMTPGEVIEQHRAAGVIEGEDAEAFAELGNVLFSGLSTTLRENIKDIDVRFHQHGVVKPGIDAEGLLDQSVLVAHSFTIQVGDYPETVGYLVIDLATAEKWNQGPIETVEDQEQAQTGGSPSTASRLEDPRFEEIPAAPIRGALAAFVSHSDVFRTLRYSCRRVGLDLRRHGKGEIPNPAAHREEIVAVDVPPGEERQFDWCKRIKEFSPENRVVLLLHHPSRSRVTQAFLSRADVILGFPCDDAQLAQKLNGLLEAVPSNEG